MRLRNIDFLPVYNAAGAQGFFGEGYPYHKYWRFLGLTYRHCGFVSKTTTLDPRPGNMPLQVDGITPRDWRPDCIVVKPWRGVVLNAVGLSGPGAVALLQTGRWQRREGAAFFISFMAVSQTHQERLEELREFVSLLKMELKNFNTQVGLELNFSCPNTNTNYNDFIREVQDFLEITARLQIPTQCKFSVTSSTGVVIEACDHPECDAITISNTIPWGAFPDRINWARIFGSDTSPLAHLGGGGLSGYPLIFIVLDWIRLFYREGGLKPIWACGGIYSQDDVRELCRIGAAGIQLGVVGMLRPWRMRGLVNSAYDFFY
jgi:dihydroorotate dehydrogenase